MEYVDRGVSGSKDRRPALDQLVLDAKRRKFDALVVWRLDRFGRNLRHLILLLDELTALGVASSRWAKASTRARQRGDCSCTSWERLPSSSARAFKSASSPVWLARERRASTSVGPAITSTDEDLARVAGLSIRAAAQELGVSKSILQRLRARQGHAAPAASPARRAPRRDPPGSHARSGAPRRRSLKNAGCLPFFHSASSTARAR